MFAYSRLIHENCERRAHFDAGPFRSGIRRRRPPQGLLPLQARLQGAGNLRQLPIVLFGDAGMQSWPVGTGHPCIGCSEKGIGFAKPIHALAELKNQRPPVGYARVAEEQGKGVSTAGSGGAFRVVGAAVGAGAMLTKKLAGRRTAMRAAASKMAKRVRSSSNGCQSS